MRRQPSLYVCVRVFVQLFACLYRTFELKDSISGPISDAEFFFVVAFADSGLYWSKAESGNGIKWILHLN